MTLFSWCWAGNSEAVLSNVHMHVDKLRSRPVHCTEFPPVFDALLDDRMGT